MDSEQTRQTITYDKHIKINNQISLGALIDAHINEFFLKIEDSRLSESV